MESFLNSGRLDLFATLAIASGVMAISLTAFASLLQNRILTRRIKGNFDGGLTVEDVEAFKQSPNEERPFEVAALASYYNKALSRTTVSFWFSLFFASVGFSVIVIAFVTHTNGNMIDTLIKVVSGTVIDAVSALFFVQSTNAQKSMNEFFEKLRLDRLNVEAREMINEIENAERRDQLRAQLVIKYSGIEKLIEAERS